MKINPDDPYFPSPYKRGENCPHTSEGTGGCPACLGVTIRLHLAESAMQGMVAGWLTQPDVANLPDWDSIAADADSLADAMIERANRDERTDNGE